MTDIFPISVDMQSESTIREQWLEKLDDITRVLANCCCRNKRCKVSVKLETVSIAEPLQNWQHTQNP